MCMSDCTLRMTSTGQGEPAMTPVRSGERSNWPKLGCARSAMSMLGTP
jgi:hypothetical protein